MLAGAGLNPADVTPELARTFGQILRVVVSGVMDVMRSRQQIKDEFRMRMTQFRPAENNPLKFSANVDDALHNLLVKRNAAYLRRSTRSKTPLTTCGIIRSPCWPACGWRSNRCSPSSIRIACSRSSTVSSAKGLMPAKLRYWDLYREKRDEMVKDPGSELPPVVRRGVRAGLRRAAQAAQGPGRQRRTSVPKHATTIRYLIAPGQRSGGVDARRSASADPFRRNPDASVDECVHSL